MGGDVGKYPPKDSYHALWLVPYFPKRYALEQRCCKLPKDGLLSRGLELRSDSKAWYSFCDVEVCLAADPKNSECLHWHLNPYFKRG